ncbi:hypothetical protein EJ04DRAFT_569212 [Polyplosphaeria fusca]|uniref:Uncharacterized protein n=1 Tax=Polyplosphaeria fusca TaxID=682080 RepID=A0A9P4UW14_9PLEO|nr:hypothetical protein EJ04DRAFT_569212 [Polyplosphaeria fusca]
MFRDLAALTIQIDESQQPRRLQDLPFRDGPRISSQLGESAGAPPTTPVQPSQHPGSSSATGEGAVTKQIASEETEVVDMPKSSIMLESQSSDVAVKGAEATPLNGNEETYEHA